MSEHDGLASLFHSLSPDAQAAALVYGVVDPHVRTTWQVAQILRHADIRSGGRRLADARLRDAARELVKRGLAYAPRRDGGLRASPHWAPWLTMEAHRTGTMLLGSAWLDHDATAVLDLYVQAVAVEQSHARERAYAYRPCFNVSRLAVPEHRSAVYVEGGLAAVGQDRLSITHDGQFQVSRQYWR